MKTGQKDDMKTCGCCKSKDDPQGTVWMEVKANKTMAFAFRICFSCFTKLGLYLSKELTK